jgi:GT2 family glycosyltransferase
MSSTESQHFSVLIPHYGAPGPTLSLIGQLAAQKPHEIIVVDDASPTPLRTRRKGVQVIRRTTNGGFGTAVNTGAKNATGNWLLIFNSDLEVGPHFLSQLRPRLSQPAIYSPSVRANDLVPVWTGRRWPTVTHQALEWATPLARFRDRSWWHRGVGHQLTNPISDTEVEWVIGAAMAIPRDEFLAVGGFDERFFMNCEEIDLQRRLRARGLPSIALALPQVVHAGGGSTDPALHREWLVTARLLYAEKWGGKRALQLALRGVSMLNLLWNTFRRLRGVDVRPWQTSKKEWQLLSNRRLTQMAERGPNAGRATHH